MMWIKTLDDLRELDRSRDLPDEMLEQMRGLLEGMRATYGGSEELEAAILSCGLTALEAAKKVSREHDISFEEIWRMMPDRLR